MVCMDLVALLLNWSTDVVAVGVSLRRNNKKFALQLQLYYCH